MAEGESRRRELTWSTIPIDEARRSSLEDALAAEPRILTNALGSNDVAVANFAEEEGTSGDGPPI